MGVKVENVDRNNPNRWAVRADFIVDGVIELTFIKTKDDIVETSRWRLDKNRFYGTDLTIFKDSYQKAKNMARGILGKCQGPVKKPQAQQLSLF